MTKLEEYQKYIEYGLNVDYSKALDDSLYLRAYNAVLCTTIDLGENMDITIFIEAFCTVLSKIIKEEKLITINGTLYYKPSFISHNLSYNEYTIHSCEKNPTPIHIDLIA